MTHETDTPPPLPGAANESAATPADDVLASRQAFTDDALQTPRNALTEGLGQQPVSTSAHKPPTSNFPSYLAYLLDRAAALLQVHGVGTVVSFAWWSDGKEVTYTARLVWNRHEFAPRLVVFHARSGDFVCESLVGELFRVEPSTWCIDVPSDEVDRDIWEQTQRNKKRRAR